MIPLQVNGKQLCQIFEPNLDISNWTDEQIDEYSRENQMYPTSVSLTSEQYSRDAERTADYELEYLILVNRKASPVFEWSLIKVEYVQKLLAFLNYTYNFKNGNGVIVPKNAEDIRVTYLDFIGTRTIISYLGQTLEGELREYDGQLYWENFRIAFPER